MLEVRMLDNRVLSSRLVASLSYSSSLLSTVVARSTSSRLLAM